MDKEEQHHSGFPYCLVLADIPSDWQFSLCLQENCREGAETVLWERGNNIGMGKEWEGDGKSPRNGGSGNGNGNEGEKKAIARRST